MPDTRLFVKSRPWCDGVSFQPDLAHTPTPRYICSLFGLFCNNWRSYRKCLYIFCCCCLVTKLGLTLCDPIDCSLPDSSIHGISQARIQEWVVISFSRGSSWPRDGTQVCSHCRQTLYHLSHQGSPRALKYRDLTPYWIYQPSGIILLQFWTIFLIDAN